MQVLSPRRRTSCGWSGGFSRRAQQQDFSGQVWEVCKVQVLRLAKVFAENLRCR
jgi:hypothetical protein